MKKKILTAARAESIPEGWSGLWFIRKADQKEDKVADRHGGKVLLPAGVYTHLLRVTTERLHREPPGEVVMEDTPFELRTHLNFMMKAYGQVLVTGLGLGCVVRGLLQNPRVDFITCIEKSKHVLNLIEPFMPKERLKIIHADALEWVKLDDRKFDCAYHDIWADTENGDEPLAHLHSLLLLSCRKKAKYQDAWGLFRPVKQLLKNHGVNFIRPR